MAWEQYIHRKISSVGYDRDTADPHIIFQVHSLACSCLDPWSCITILQPSEDR